MSSPPPRTSSDSLGSSFSTTQLDQYPFPQYESPQRPTSSGRYQLRRGSTASSITSIGGVLDSSAHGRTLPIRESAQNAISTLLQPPIVRTGLLPHTATSLSSGHKPPSAKDIPPVSLTNLEHVDSSVFKPYLSQAGPLYEAFQRAKATGDDNGSLLFRKDREAEKVDEFAESLEPSLKRQRSNGSINSLTISPLESPYPRRRSSGGSQRRLGHAVAPLSTIPNVYFDDDFHLENPRTFDVVSDRSDIVRPAPGNDNKVANGSLTTPAASGRKALATNAILQEKLSWYMDTVEVHLISSISTASTSFFAALGSLRELHSEAADSVAKIKRLRADLATLDNDMATGGLQIVGLRRRRDNLRKLGEAVEQLRMVTNEVAHCDDLIEQGDMEKALDTVEGLESLIAGEEGPLLLAAAERPKNLIDLRGLKALEGASEEMNQLRYRVGKGFEARFLESLLGDLRHHVKSVPATETLQRWGNASQRSRGDHTHKPSAFPAYLTLDNKLRFDLLSHLDGLSRSHHTMPATTAFRDAALREMKSLIRQHLPSSTDDDNESMISVSTHSGRQLSQQEKSSILARNLRALDPDAAEELLMKIYCGVGEALRRLSTQVKVLLDLTSGVGSRTGGSGVKSPPKSPNVPTLDSYLNKPTSNASPSASRMQEELTQALDMSSLLGQAVDIAQTQITKILKVRSEQSTHLPLLGFLRYFTINRLFADECEAISGRSGTALKNVVNTHIKEFVSQMGDSEIQRLAHTMETDRWDAKDFGGVDSTILSRVLEGSTRDVSAWARGSHVWEEPSENDDVASNVDDPESTATNGTGTAAKVRSATFDDQKYILPLSAIAVLHGVESFESLISSIPSMTSEVATNLLDYLKLFSSRSYQLILGAGATRSAGLKNITTKHLAITSQALSFIIALIPYMREFIRRHAPSSHALTAEFDKVKRLYQDHQSNIHDKFVEIMSGRASMHVHAMKKVDWNDTSGPETPNSYMETLTRETTTLHKVLSKHLPEVTVGMIMDPVFASYREQWGNAFSEIPAKTEAAKQKILRDAELFRSRLSKLDGSGDIGDYMVKLVQEKPVEEKEIPAPSVAASAAPSSESEASRPASPKKVSSEKPRQDEDGAAVVESSESKPEAA
ncbi:MAG: hypothetical protein M1819_002895 [Sarea resinae]|nr:MAG: hypothetical protein M1819_002895 [Sarea resinae]